LVELLPGGKDLAILHKKLDVYRLALDFVEVAAEVVKHIPRGQSYLSDQLKRSAASSVLNIGEGAGEFAKKEKVRFYRMALRSATESASTVDIVHQFGYTDSILYAKAESLLERIIGMLTKLIQRHGQNMTLIPAGQKRQRRPGSDLY
jgi:four helix bundle protein